MKKLERATTLRSQMKTDDWTTRVAIINDAAVGSVFILKTTSYGPSLPALLIYKSQPVDTYSGPVGPGLKNITIIFYHDGQLKEFRVSTEARLTYMVKC